MRGLLLSRREARSSLGCWSAPQGPSDSGAARLPETIFVISGKQTLDIGFCAEWFLEATSGDS